MCCVEMRMVLIPLGFPSSPYSTVTCVFPSGEDIGYGPILAGQGELVGQLIGDGDRKRHQVRGLVTGITEHHTLVPGSQQRVGILGPPCLTSMEPVTPMLMSGLCSSRQVSTAQVFPSKPASGLS